jgi:hypothetical protein
MATPSVFLTGKFPPQPPSASFASLVAWNVIAKRLSVIVPSAILTAIFCVPVFYLFPAREPWFAIALALGAAWLALDIISIRFRVASGQYGSTSYEVLEAAAYIADHKKGGGRRFKKVFGGRRKRSSEAISLTDGVVAGTVR